MRDLFRVRNLVVVVAVVVAMGTAGLLVADVEDPWEGDMVTGGSSTFGSVVVELTDGPSEPVDAWEMAEPYVTTYLTAEIPSDTTLQVSITGTVEVGGSSADPAELP